METESPSPTLDMERAVYDRYSKAAGAREEALCCPVSYDPRYLEVIPKQVLERDYGCGDPSRHVRAGDTVVDLGSGGGKICFVAAQIVGSKGRVIGIDMNEEMLDLARRSAPGVAEKIGYSNVRFHRARIQDLRLDLDRLEGWLAENPVRTVGDMAVFEEFCEGLRREEPLIPDESVDIVVSNCVLNLVRPSAKPELIRELFRIVKPGGRIAISDIVSDEPVPEDLQAHPELWSGCISGAFHEVGLLRALEEAGFHALTIDKWQAEPLRVVQGIEFRAVTVTARKEEPGLSEDAGQTVIYRGPWKRVEDDAGHVLARGERTAVGARTLAVLRQEPYASCIIPIDQKGGSCCQ